MGCISEKASGDEFKAMLMMMHVFEDDSSDADTGEVQREFAKI